MSIEVNTQIQYSSSIFKFNSSLDIFLPSFESRPFFVLDIKVGSKMDLFDYISKSLYLFFIRCFLFLFNSKCTFKLSFNIHIQYSNSNFKILRLVMSVRTVSVHLFFETSLKFSVIILKYFYSRFFAVI